MKTIEQKRKTTTGTPRRGKAVPGLTCTKRGVSPNKSAKQRLKTSGKDGKFSELCSPGPTPPLSPDSPTSVPTGAFLCSHKFKLQLFPIDEATRRGLDMEKHNPFLELTIGTRKKISSVVNHLNIKWGKSKIASGELTLFPYYAQPDNLASHKRWTLMDSGITAADVHLVVGSPAIFRLRYGWFAQLELKISRMPLMPSLSENTSEINNIPKKNTADYEIPSSLVSIQEYGHAQSVDSSNEDADKSTQLGKTAEQQDKQRTDNSSILLWDLSNNSFGALLPDTSKNTNISLVNCESFDAAIAQFKATYQSTPLHQQSIFDAEETCNAFCFRKVASSPGLPSAQSQDAPAASIIQNLSPNSLKLHDAIESLGHLEYAAAAVPSFKQLLGGGDSISIDGLIASSRDGSQKFSIFKYK